MEDEIAAAERGMENERLAAELDMAKNELEASKKFLEFYRAHSSTGDACSSSMPASSRASFLSRHGLNYHNPTPNLH